MGDLLLDFKTAILQPTSAQSSSRDAKVLYHALPRMSIFLANALLLVSFHCEFPSRPKDQVL